MIECGWLFSSKFEGNFLSQCKDRNIMEVSTIQVSGYTAKFCFDKRGMEALQHHFSPGAKGLKWRFFAHESVQAEFGLKL